MKQLVVAPPSPTAVEWETRERGCSPDTTQPRPAQWAVAFLLPDGRGASAPDSDGPGGHRRQRTVVAARCDGDASAVRPERVNQRLPELPTAAWATSSTPRSSSTTRGLERDADSGEDMGESCFAVAMTTSAVPVVCAAGDLDRCAVDELHATLLAHLRHCVDESAIICDLSQARMFDPSDLTRLLADTAARAATHSVRLLVLACPGMPTSASTTVPSSSGAGTYTLLDDMDAGLRRTGRPELEHDDQQVRRILDRTIRRGLRDLRGQPPYDTIDPATRQALRWRLTDAAHAGVDAGSGLLAAAACVRRALTHLSARQHQDAYFALLTAEDHLAGRVEPSPDALATLPAPPAPSIPEPRSDSGPEDARGRFFVVGRPPARRTQPTGGRG